MFIEYGPEVFYVGGVNGIYVSEEVRKNMIADFGLPVATYAQVEAAGKSGGEWCATGVISDRAEMGYPTGSELVKIPGCGTFIGMQTYTPDGNIGGVHFYGIKPDPDIKSSWPAGAESVVWAQGKTYGGELMNENAIIKFKNGNSYTILPFKNPSVNRAAVYHDELVGEYSFVLIMLLVIFAVIIVVAIILGMYYLFRKPNSDEDEIVKDEVEMTE